MNRGPGSRRTDEIERPLSRTTLVKIMDPLATASRIPEFGYSSSANERSSVSGDAVVAWVATVGARRANLVGARAIDRLTQERESRRRGARTARCERRRPSAAIRLTIAGNHEDHSRVRIQAAELRWSAVAQSTRP